LNIPHIACVSVDLSALQSFGNSLAIGDGTSGSVDDPSTLIKID
jgi:hypothetical protein